MCHNLLYRTVNIWSILIATECVFIVWCKQQSDAARSLELAGLS